jgi:hypothetical protein
VKTVFTNSMTAHPGWKRNGEQCPVGKFQIDAITETGDIHAGCQYITAAELDAMRAKLGVA